MKVINLFSGPGCGKSTTATGLFYELKKRGLRVEYVSEYAKDLTYENRMDRIVDYLYVLAEQHHRLLRLQNKVDIVICDGSFLFGYIHFKKNGIYDEKLFKKLMLKMFNSYENINYFIKREEIIYQNYGRRESLEKALKMDKKILKLLNKKSITYNTIVPQTAISSILKDLL